MTIVFCPVYLSAEVFCSTCFLVAVMLLAIPSGFRSWQWSALLLPFACFGLPALRQVELQTTVGV